MGKILVVSDIHGNLSALEAVLEAESLEGLEGIILLGDRKSTRLNSSHP